MTQEQTTPEPEKSSSSLTEFRIHPHSWGANYVRAGEVLFRLWAPDVQSVTLRLNGADEEMAAAGDGWFELLATGVAADARYQFILPDGAAVADPAARAQDGGVYGPSIVTDPTTYAWATRIGRDGRGKRRSSTRFMSGRSRRRARFAPRSIASPILPNSGSPPSK